MHGEVREREMWWYTRVKFFLSSKFFQIFAGIEILRIFLFPRPIALTTFSLLSRAFFACSMVRVGMRNRPRQVQRIAE